jgi:hypothetical protein
MVHIFSVVLIARQQSQAASDAGPQEPHNRLVVAE